MFEEAGKTIASNVWGALLLLSWAIFGLVYRELKKELREERAAHQSTRSDMLAELRSQNHVSAGLVSMQDAQKEAMMYLEALSRQERRSAG
jgi:hypothetical protein